MDAPGFAVASAGTILDGRYRILGRLGRGGMGNVYAAVHVALDQRVAIKVLHPRFAEDERFRARFLQEARAVSRIRHPNVVEITDFGRAPSGSLYFVMEYLRGHDLSVELCRQGALPWPRARHILLQVAGALEAAHAQQIVHRDVKPGNCFLLDDECTGLVDVVKLVDFGLAKVGDGTRKGMTGSDEIIGTASYMSPEQARSQPLDARSDVYSLGAMAYELLTGLAPFRASTLLEVIAAHLEDEPEPVRSLAPEVPAAVDAMVLRMLAKAPEDRYPSMKAVRQALAAIPDTPRKRSTMSWTPTPPPTAAQGQAPEPAVSPEESTDRDAVATDTAVPARDERTEVLRPRASRERGRVGAWPSLGTASASLADELVGSTETQLGTNDTFPLGPPAKEPQPPSRRLSGLVLLGLLGLLAGGGTLLAGKAWLSSSAAVYSRGGTAAGR